MACRKLCLLSWARHPTIHITERHYPAEDADGSTVLPSMLRSSRAMPKCGAAAVVGGVSQPGPCHAGPFSACRPARRCAPRSLMPAPPQISPCHLRPPTMETLHTFSATCVARSSSSSSSSREGKWRDLHAATVYALPPD